MSRINRANVKKTWYYLKRNGIKNTCYAVAERLSDRKKEPYDFVPVVASELERQKGMSEQFSVTFSIVVPTYRTGEKYLQELMACVKNQSYSRWELILADATEDDSVEKLVRKFAASDQILYLSEQKEDACQNWQDSCVRYVRLSENGGISKNTNRALAYALGEYIGLLDHDDLLTEDALFEMASSIEQSKKGGVDAMMLYSDEDKCDGEGIRFFEPNIKIKFNLDLLLSNNYICHFLVMKGDLMKSLGFRPEYDGAQDYDLVLRAASKLMEQEERIVHIPKVLYHWRCHSASTAENPRSKMYAYEAGQRALESFAEEQGWKAEVLPLKHLGFYQMNYRDGFFHARKDLGAVGARLLIGHKTAGGGMTADGKVLYRGLRKGFGGYLHRAALNQDVDALDIRCLTIRSELWQLFQEVTGVSYRTIPGRDLFDVTALPQDTDYLQMSLKLSEAIRERGYRLLYTPDRVENWNERIQRLE